MPAAEARRIVRSYLAAPGFEAVNAAMRANVVAPGLLAGLDVPVTIAWGERDRLVRPPRAGVPGVREVLLRDAGHLAMWDSPDAVAELILGRYATPTGSGSDETRPSSAASSRNAAPASTS